MRGALRLVFALALAGCSVEAGKIPRTSAVRPPEVVAKTRGEVKSTLNELHESVAMIGRVQSVIQRGLSERDVAAGGSPIPANLLSASDADTLTFDDAHPERFEYRLNNSAAFSLRTKSGGKVEIVLVGTLDDLGDHVTIKDAKLDVSHTKGDDHQVFHILFEKHTSQDGTPTTEWSVDFRQLSELYQDMGGEDEAIASLSGSVEIRVSANETHVSAKDFTLNRDDVSVVFEEVEIHLVRGAESSNDVKVKGHVDQAGKRRGEFAVARAAANNGTELALNLDIR